jgi:hypothetical protein
LKASNLFVALAPFALKYLDISIFLEQTVPFVFICVVEAKFGGRKISIDIQNFRNPACRKKLGQL